MIKKGLKELDKKDQTLGLPKLDPLEKEDWLMQERRRLEELCIDMTADLKLIQQAASKKQKFGVSMTIQSVFSDWRQKFAKLLT
jgi:hypothetical protein